MEVVPADEVEFTEDMAAAAGEFASVQAQDNDDAASAASHERQLEGSQTPAFDATPGTPGTPDEEALVAGNRAAAEAKRRSIVSMEERSATTAAALQQHHPSTADRMQRLGRALSTSAEGAATAADADADAEFDGDAAELAAIIDPPGPRSLRREVAAASLSQLGHTDDGRVAFTCANLSALSLADVDALRSFPHLQRVLLDNNHLTSLEPLRSLHSLVTLSAARNELDADAFECLAGCAESLQSLDLSFNNIASLAGVAPFAFLHDLDVSHNKLTTIPAGCLRRLQSLTTLRVASNDISTVAADAFAGCNIRHLDVSQNSIADLAPFAPLRHSLMALLCSDNNVMHFSGIADFTKLAVFELAGNNAYDIQEVHSVAQLPLLRKLALAGNPLCSLDHGIEAPLEGDDASDVVRRDVPSGGRAAAAPSPAAAAVAAATTSSTTADAAAAAAAVAVERSPEEEDQAEYAQQPAGAQYRLCVLWRAPRLTHLDGIEVTPEELTRARNLQGGADRTARAAAKASLLCSSSGAPALVLRKAKRAAAAGVHS